LLKLFINPYIKNFIFNETWKLIQPKENNKDTESETECELLLDENYRYVSTDEED